MGAEKIRVRLWHFGVTVFAALSFATTSIGADRHSYDITFQGRETRTIFQLAFLPDKVLIKGLSLAAFGGCHNRGLVVPKNGGEVRTVSDNITWTATATSTYLSQGPAHRIRIDIEGQSKTKSESRTRTIYELSLQLEANSCRLISYALGSPTDEEMKHPGAIVKMLDGTSSSTCMQQPLSSFEEDSCKH